MFPSSSGRQEHNEPKNMSDSSKDPQILRAHMLHPHSDPRCPGLVNTGRLRPKRVLGSPGSPTSPGGRLATKGGASSTGFQAPCSASKQKRMKTKEGINCVCRLGDMTSAWFLHNLGEV